MTAYSPALVSAQNDLTLTSGKDMDIIGSKAQGEKITAKVGGNLRIETLQEKETYEEDNHSTGFGVSWNVNQTKRETTDANGNTKIETLRSFSKPTFSGSWNKGNIDSHYRSARDQAGFFAGKGGFDIYVEKNTDLKGAVIASEASPEKNKLTTGTLTFSDLENTASYKVSDKGVSLHVGGNVKPGDKGLLPATHMPIHGSASNVTKSAVSSGAIEILRRPIQDLAGLSRNTDNAQKPLEKIFDKDKILEQQEAAELFGELANRAVGDISERMHWKEGDPRKIFLKGLTAGIMNRIAGGSFGKGMTAGAVNELLIARLLSWQDAYGHPIIPMELLQGISYGAGMAIDGTEGAVIAQSGTKHNIFEHLEYFLDEQEREAFLKAVEACGGDEYEVAQVFEQGGYLQRALSRIGKTPTPGYEYKPIIYTKADGTKFVRIVEVEKNASTKTPDEDGFTKTNIIDDKNSGHTEERIYWGGWQHNPQIAEKPKEEREGERADEGNTAATIRKSDVNKKDSKGSVLQDGQPSDKLESHSHTSPLEEQKGTNENHELKGNFDPVKETVQNALTNKEGILYGGIVDSDKTGMLSKNARIGLKIFGSAGGISGTILSGMDFVKDYHEYSGIDLVKVWGTDAFALAIGFGGSAIGGTLLGGPPGAYVGGVLGGVGGAYVKSWLREGIKKDKEKAAAAYKDIERR